MSDERIDIEVTDKIDKNVETKILGIARASDKGFTAVKRLKAELASIRETSTQKLAAAANAANVAILKEATATSKLTIAQANADAATARAALSTQKLATEQARTAAATLKAESAARSSATAKDREAASSAKLTSELAREASARKRIINDRTVVPQNPNITADNRLGGPTGSRSEAAAATNQMRRVQPIRTNDIIPPDLKPKLDQTVQGLGGLEKGGGLARHSMVNLGYQLQDVVVSLQAGQKPLTVFIQQGSQIAGIAAASGVGFFAMARAVWALVAPFTPLIAVLGLAYVGFKNFTSDMGTKHNAELKAYANTLGLTEKEMRKLGNETVGASGKLKEFDTVIITSGDSWNGFVATVKEGISGLSVDFSALGGVWGTVWDTVTSFLRNAFIGFYGLVVGGMRGIARIIGNLPAVTGETVKAIANLAIGSVEWMINKAIDGINFLTSGARGLLEAAGYSFGEIGQVSFGRYARSGASAVGVIAGAVGEAVNEADATLRGFSQRWEDNTLNAAKNRIASAADALKANRNPAADKKDRAGPKPKVDHTAENRAQALKVLNDALDKELSRMKMLKQEREIQARMDQITNDLLQKKITLTNQESAAILAKVTAIEKFKFVQTEFDRVVEEAIAPGRTYNAVVEGVALAQEKMAITADEASAQIAKARRAYEEALDPMVSFNEAIVGAESASYAYGQAVETANYAEQVRQAYLARGIDLMGNATAAQKAAASATIENNNALLQQQFIQSQIGGIVNPMLETQRIVSNKANMYAEIQRLRDSDVLNEQQAQQAKLALDARFSELRLANMSATFGELAKLSASGNGELAAIGKAAAVAQATMDGYVAVQKALASGPPPFNYIQAAAVAAMTGVQVAGIVSTNVGSFATGGQFMVNGRTGVDANNINMNVTKGERVTIETPAQQRANDGNGSGEGGMGDVKIVNVSDPRDAVAAMSSSEGERVILNVIRKNPKAIKGIVG